MTSSYSLLPLLLFSFTALGALSLNGFSPLGVAGQLSPPSINSLTTSGCLNLTTCLPPFTLSISGSNFSASTSLVNISNTWCQPSLALSSSSLLVCQVPNVYLPLAMGPSQSVPVSVFDFSSAFSSNIVASFHVEPLPPIRLLGIEGCQGGGTTTNGCDLRSSVITLVGDGFVVDGQPWTVIFSTLTGWTSLFRLQPTPAPVNSLTLPLNLTLYSVVRDSNAPTGNMTICLTHRSQLSNCLALSYSYSAGGNSSQPIITVPPVSGMVTTPDISITSVTGCPLTYPNGSTSGCSSDSRLTITGTGFPLIPALTRLISIGDVTRGYCNLLNGSTYLCSLDDTDLISVPMNQWLSVIIIDTVAVRQSPPFIGVQYTEPPLVQLTSISGCAGDGLQVGSSPVPAALSTTLCTFADVLTLSGSGFVQPGGIRRPWQAVVALMVSSGGSDSPQQLSSLVTSKGGLSFANSSTILVSVASVLSGLLMSVATATFNVSICLLHGNQLSTQCAAISTLTPSPIISGVNCGQFPANSSMLAVSGCSAGVSTLTIWGERFLASTSVTVAGQPCAPLQTFTNLYCILPAIIDLVPGRFYDLTLSTSLTSITLPAAVAFTSTPSLVSLSSQFCPPDFLPSTSTVVLNCVQGSVLTIIGSFFSPQSSLSVLISSLLPSPSLSVQCEGVTLQSAYQLTCQLPSLNQTAALAASFYTLGTRVVVLDNATSSRSNSLTVKLYSNPLSDPRIDSIQGCVTQVSSTRVVSGCSIGEVITLLGANFVSSSTTQVQVYDAGDAFICASPTLLSSFAMTCILPYTPTSAADSVLPIRIFNMNGKASNWLVSIDYQSSNDLSSGGGIGDLRFILTLALLLPVIALLVTLLFVQHWKKQRGGKGFSGWMRHHEDSRDDKVQMVDIGGRA